MRQPNPVQPISQHRVQFQSRLPPSQPGAQQQPPPQVAEQMQDLAMEIYARMVAGEHNSATSYTNQLESSHLHQLARDAQAAARAYFESMGVQNEQ